MILAALGSNKAGPWGSPRQTVERALQELDRDGVKLEGTSRLIVSSPFGQLDQPPFINAVALISTDLPPQALMDKLHAIETSAGRRRGPRWGPRTLDLDLLDYHGLIQQDDTGLVLPHPGIAERIFVLKPLAELAPSWIHPVLHESAAALLGKLDAAGEGAEI
ncbi:MAG: 2-amino-4-hydroxy-6-hydroxymethyldihydropteridine diphosphokinase [Rhizobiales bacterium]|nr:2-amino-4-hydroxy-6-hydroxymethyldihydropteridine diphosphokinase [Hyphomicrobiales bacterium]